MWLTMFYVLLIYCVIGVLTAIFDKTDATKISMRPDGASDKPSEAKEPTTGDK
jgi:hypothetical protein